MSYNGFEPIRVPGLDDSGIVPGSAAISTVQATKLGARVEPCDLEVNTAATAGKLKVAGKIACLIMATTPRTFLQLKNVLLYHNFAFTTQSNMYKIFFSLFIV